MARGEDGTDEGWNASEYESNSMTWCTKGGALSVGLMKAK